jgi:2-hydroxy-4-carboxymuconate semialdehyde hemiacetal dehydrogenase
MDGIESAARDPGNRRGGRQIGLCVVGPGAIAGAHLEALTTLGCCRNTWVVGRSRTSAAGFAERWGFEQSGSELDTALADPAVELVLIASPNQVHGAQALRALDAGKHVIVEIPAALRLAEAEQLEYRGRQVGRRVFVCHTLRSYPAFRELRARVLAKTLTISQIDGFFAVPRRHNENWVGGQRSWVDDLLWHHGGHYIDISLWTLGAGSATSICAHFGRKHPQFGMTMDVAVSFVASTGALVSHTLTYNTSTGLSELRFVTDDDILIVRELGLYRANEEELVPAVDWADLLVQDRELLEAVINERASDFDIESVLPAMRVLEEAQTSGDIP